MYYCTIVLLYYMFYMYFCTTVLYVLLFKSIYWSKSTGTNKNKLYIYISTICTFWFSDFNKCVDENKNKLYRQRLIK